MWGSCTVFFRGEIGKKVSSCKVYLLQPTKHTEGRLMSWRGKPVRQIIVRRLFESFSELERAIGSLRTVIENQENPSKELLARISSYEEILSKQKTLATTLLGHASLGNWNEVTRHVKLISGLSSMIRDDARDVLETRRVDFKEEDRTALMC